MEIPHIRMYCVLYKVLLYLKKGLQNKNTKTACHTLHIPPKYGRHFIY